MGKLVSVSETLNRILVSHHILEYILQARRTESGWVWPFFFVRFFDADIFHFLL